MLSRLSKTWCISSVLKLQISPAHLTATLQNFSPCQSKMPSVFQQRLVGGGGEAVSGGSTWLWSSLDQAIGLDLNRELSSHYTAQLMTLLQDRLTENSLTVSLPGFECPLKTGSYIGIEEKVSGCHGSKTRSSWFDLCTPCLGASLLSSGSGLLPSTCK